MVMNEPLPIRCPLTGHLCPVCHAENDEECITVTGRPRETTIDGEIYVNADGVLLTKALMYQATDMEWAKA